MERQNRDIARKLDLEIAERLYQYRYFLRQSKETPVSKYGDYWLKQALDEIGPVSFGSGSSSVHQPSHRMFPEFDKRNLVSLLVQLASVVPSRKEKHEIQEATKTARTLMDLDFRRQAELAWNDQRKHQIVNKQLQESLDTLSLDRWSIR